MKNIKLFYSVLIGLMIFTSCSKDDNPNPDSSTSIVGVWQPIKDIEVCSTGSEHVLNFDACELTSRTTFSEDGNLTQIFYYLEGNDCVLDYNKNGTWKINEGNLTINFPSEIFEATFFELSKNRLRIGEYDNTDGPCDGGNLSSHYYLELTRVE